MFKKRNYFLNVSTFLNISPSVANFPPTIWIFTVQLHYKIVPYNLRWHSEFLKYIKAKDSNIAVTYRNKTKTRKLEKQTLENCYFAVFAIVWVYSVIFLKWTIKKGGIILVPFYKNNGFSLVTCCFENFLVHLCLLYLIALQINWWKLRSWVHQLENIPRSRFLSIDLVSTCNELSLD